MADILPPFNLGTAGLDLSGTFDTSAFAKSKSFPVGPAEVAVMAFVGGLALMLAFGPTSPKRRR